MGAVLEASGFHPGRSGRDHLRVMATAAGLPVLRVDQVLEQVGMPAYAGRRVRGYSLGMRQRLGLAAALLGDPRVLILDEPANGLDPEGVHWLRGFLRSLAAHGRTVLISSHALAEVAQTVDRVVIIARGRLVAESSLQALVERRTVGVRLRSPQAEELRARLVARGIPANLDGPGVVSHSGPPCTPVGANLEKVFLELTEVAEPAGPSGMAQEGVPPRPD